MSLAMTALAKSMRRPQGGFSLVEIMVGVVIGLIAVLVIYQAFAASEGIKRNTTSMGDAQQNGLISSFALGIELGNAGNGIASARAELGTCPDTGDIVTSMRPVPILITDGGAPGTPDQFVVNYSFANTLVLAAPFQPLPGTSFTTPADSNYPVQSAVGFHPEDIVIAISNDAAQICLPSKVTRVCNTAGACATPPAVAVPDVSGVVLVQHTATGSTAGMPNTSVLLNLGPSGRGQKVRYDVQGAVLRSQTLLDANGLPSNAQPVNPLASNIVNLKLQYGIDNVGDGSVHAWISATCPGAWCDTNVLALPASTVCPPAPAVCPAPAPALDQIKAVRVGIIVRSEQFDRNVGAVPWSLFGGTYSGTFAASTAPAGNFRYRTYETVIPLRNEIWNSGT